MSKLSDYFYFVYFYLIDSARCLDKVITILDLELIQFW